MYQNSEVIIFVQTQPLWKWKRPNFRSDMPGFELWLMIDWHINPLRHYDKHWFSFTELCEQKDRFLANVSTQKDVKFASCEKVIIILDYIAWMMAHIECNFPLFSQQNRCTDVFSRFDWYVKRIIWGVLVICLEVKIHPNE